MERRRTKKYRIKSKVRFITSLIVVLGLCIGLFGFVTGSDTSTAVTKNGCTTVEICAGDTLWEIAENVKSKDMDTRVVVYEICKANNIKAGDIQPGMILEIPEYL
ncbi:MAG: LysM peptidoglycan-binding domain-containing protein [Firmicutes bacterium]|nr:LysM peptidoglycan-binding domain-containing protein [Bacillota bacterium]